MSDYNENEERSPFEKYGLAIVIGVMILLMAGVGVGVYLFAGKIPPPRKPEEIMVRFASSAFAAAPSTTTTPKDYPTPTENG